MSPPHTTPPEQESVTSSLSYHLNAENLIVSADLAWDAFAVENGAPELLSTRITGEDLFGFITGMEMQHLQKMLLGRVRKTLQPSTIPFRCDAPDRRRFMEMTVTAQADGAVAFVTWLTHEETRDPVALLQASSRASATYLALCGWCN